jgi:hypothetical protein
MKSQGAKSKNVNYKDSTPLPEMTSTVVVTRYPMLGAVKHIPCVCKFYQACVLQFPLVLAVCALLTDLGVREITGRAKNINEGEGRTIKLQPNIAKEILFLDSCL